MNLLIFQNPYELFRFLLAYLDFFWILKMNVTLRVLDMYLNEQFHGCSLGQKISKFANFLEFRWFSKLKKFWKFVNFPI